MDKDIVRAIGFLNLVKAEYSDKLYKGELNSLNEVLIALRRLAK